MDYEAVIGLEIHAQLLTDSKLFCACSTKFGEPPNHNACPICTGLPGVLPVLNRKAVEYAIKMALATDCKINNRSIFARKNYFYPDLPKAYQVSQYEEPLSEHGHVDIVIDGDTRRIGITRIHMEEDAGKLVHGAAGKSFVDFNRCGVPLIEIVSEPDMRTPEEANAYLKALHDVLVYLEICDGNMEEGSFRCDANISIRPVGREEFGTKAELKNMNSFRFIERALNYEIERQTALISAGGKVVQETRLWDAEKGITNSMRGKEEAHDYRYFPEPDLLPLIVDDEWIDKVRDSLPELPAEKRERFVNDFGIPNYDAGVICSDKYLAAYFEECVSAHNNPKAISNWIMSELMRELKSLDGDISKSPISATDLARMVAMIDEGTITGKIAKTVFEKMWETGKDPDTIVDEEGLKPIEDVGKYVEEAIEANPKQVEQYLNGKDKLVGFFVGQVMKATRGRADPKSLNSIVIEKLNALKDK